MINYNEQPAFPPQVAQDNLGRLMAPIPGMSKLEFFSIMLLPVFIKLQRETDGLRHEGKPVTPTQAAIIAAKKFINEINDAKDEKPNFEVVE